MRRHRPSILLFIVLILLLLFVQFSLSDYCSDDAYIHFRISRNLASHGAPYFNLNEKVMTSSSPGWTLLLALLFRLFGIHPVMVVVLNACLSAAAVFMAVMVTREFAAGRTVGAKLQVLTVCMVLPPLLYSSLELMETPLAICLLLAGQFLCMRRHASGYTLLVAASCVRIELVVFACFRFLFDVSKRHVRLMEIVPALLLLVLCTGYNLVYFGQMFPHAASAKSIVYSLDSYEVARRVLGNLVGGLTSRDAECSLRILFGIGMLGGSIAIMAEAFLNERKRNRGLESTASSPDEASRKNGSRMENQVAATFSESIVRDRNGGLTTRFVEISMCLLIPALIVALVYIHQRVLLHQWYVPLYATPFVISMVSIGILKGNRVWLVILLLAAVPGILGFGRTVYAACGHPQWYFRFANATVRQYLAVGPKLNDCYPGVRVMVSEIGGLGFAYHGTILDGVGLASPDALQYHPMKVPEERTDGSVGAIPVRYVEAIKPELIVSTDFFIQALLKSPVLENYSCTRYDPFLPRDMKIARKEFRDFGYLRVFVRKDVARNEAAGSSCPGSVERRDNECKSVEEKN